MLEKLFEKIRRPSPPIWQGQDLWLICGLGNPGDKYLKTWHNCGFMVVDILAQRHDISVRRMRHQSLIGQGSIQGQRCLLQKPSTYMNRSGDALHEALAYTKTDLARCFVIYDDIDLPIGQIRLRPGGGPGTHNGMRSIIRRLGEDAFPRLRVGIGPKPQGPKIADYVLSDIPKSRQEDLWQALNRAADAVELVLAEGLEAAMSRFNRTED